MEQANFSIGKFYISYYNSILSMTLSSHLGIPAGGICSSGVDLLSITHTQNKLKQCATPPRGICFFSNYKIRLITSQINFRYQGNGRK